jgi:hypothetical protein
MRKTIVASALALAALCLGREARAQAWGMHSGDTLRSGDNMLYGELGWPDLSVGFQHGMSDRFDLGFRFSLLYGYDYTTFTQLGMGMRVPLRFAVVKGPRFSFLIHVDPGLKFDAFSNGAGCFRDHPLDGIGCNGLEFGLQFPVGLEFGLHITPQATFSFGMEIPFYVNLTNGVYGSIPILFGPGFEYRVDDHIALGLNTRFGPTIFASSDAGGQTADAAVFGLITQGYFAYRL